MGKKTPAPHHETVPSPALAMEAIQVCAWSLLPFIWGMGSGVLSKHIELLGRACQALEVCFSQLSQHVPSQQTKPARSTAPV